MRNFVASILLFWSGWAAAAPSLVEDHRAVFNHYSSGTLVVMYRERAMYLVLGQNRAIRYPVTVPKAGAEWNGDAYIASRQKNPAWGPPDVVRRDHPDLPAVIPGGAPNNPLGAAVFILNRDQLGIHGTSQKLRQSIGTRASYGCIRMLNEDVLDLWNRVEIGTRVVMVR